MKPVLSVTKLHTFFRTPDGTARAVDGVSLDLFPGRTTALVGESGCGKSITALSIVGLAGEGSWHESGSVRYRDQELLGLPYAKLRRIRGNEISMIFQEPMTSLNPVLTIGAQVTECLRAHRDISRTEAKTRAEAALGESGIPDPGRRLREYPHQLSGGMKQRVMIAMALITEPSVLIADEPTTALDVTIQAQILDLMRRLQRERETAVLLITHDIGVVAEMAQDIVVMYGGTTVEQGSTAQVLSRPSHPYTRALLASLPSLSTPGKRLEAIPGTVPPATAYPPGCRFCGRCAYEIDRCRREQPALRSAPGGTSSACHRLEEITA